MEGDWSSTSYFLALGALSEGITVNNLKADSLQGDKIMINFLQDMGASVAINNNSVTVKGGDLKAIHADLTDCIDLLPTMAVLAAVSDGTSELTGIERARIKESNRVAAVKEGLERMGIDANEEQNKLTIADSRLKGTVIDSKGDHRVAMAFSILGLAIGDTVINGAECVSKTYPAFWSELKNIGGEVTIHEQ